VDPNANYGDRLSDYTNTWKVTEKLTTPYIKLDIDTHFLGVPLTGNIGVQTQTADQSSDIFFAAPQTGGGNTVAGSVVTVGKKYTDVLPSMNLSFEVADDLYLRAAAAVTEARPRMDELAGGAGFTTIADSQPPLIGPNGQKIYWTQNGGGNPYLRPWKADAYDLSLEKYFSNKAYLSAAVYYKSLKSYIYPRFTSFDFTGVPLPNNPGLTYTLADANRIGVGKFSANGQGGGIQGIELAASIPFGILTPVLQGFGVTASAAWNRSYVNPYGMGDVPVEGLSPKVFNTTLYYERGGFSARVSNRYRGEFIGEVPAYDSSLTTNHVKSESILDAQIGYSFESGRLQGLSLNLSGSNLTNAPFVLYQLGAPAFDIIKYENYGATYAFLIRYKF
jgi:iron complex outermembrane receptor protein